MIKKLLFILFILTFKAQSAVIKDIVVDGNDRVSQESIQMFSSVKLGDAFIFHSPVVASVEPKTVGAKAVQSQK